VHRRNIVCDSGDLLPPLYKKKMAVTITTTLSK